MRRTRNRDDGATTPQPHQARARHAGATLSSSARRNARHKAFESSTLAPPPPTPVSPLQRGNSPAQQGPLAARDPPHRLPGRGEGRPAPGGTGRSAGATAPCRERCCRPRRCGGQTSAGSHGPLLAGLRRAGGRARQAANALRLREQSRTATRWKGLGPLLIPHLILEFGTQIATSRHRRKATGHLQQ